LVCCVFGAGDEAGAGAGEGEAETVGEELGEGEGEGDADTVAEADAVPSGAPGVSAAAAALENDELRFVGTGGNFLVCAPSEVEATPPEKERDEMDRW
jgi:hypothetical protein